MLDERGKDLSLRVEYEEIEVPPMRGDEGVDEFAEVAAEDWVEFLFRSDEVEENIDHLSLLDLSFIDGLYLSSEF
jgi:hypothetical protein